MTSTALADLAAALPEPVLVTDPDLIRSYCCDEADLCPAGTPLAVVRAGSRDEVATVLRVASAHRLAVVAQGARTGLAGGANAIDGCVVVSLIGMRRIIEVDPVNRLAVVQPGVITAEISRAAAPYGLCYPPDPGSWESATIGGNVATNAGGMCCVKYGVTGDYVLGLEVVLADGRLLRCGRRTRKGVAGYDLTRLFVGSEGTLGVITEITVALRPTPAQPSSLAALFDSVAAAGEAVAAIAGAAVTPSLLELLDAVHLSAIEAHRSIGLPTGTAALLLAAVDSGAAVDQSGLALIEACCRDAGAIEVHVSSSADEAGLLLAARRLAHPAMEAYARAAFPSGAGALIIDDVAVPVSRLAQLLAGVADIASRHDLTIGVVGHAGDGNMHPNIVVDRADSECLRRGRAAFDEIMRLGLELGGTCTGEHGIGLLKRDWLATELGPAGLAVHRAIKDAFDPLGILNPGKILAPSAAQPSITSMPPPI